MRKTQKKPFQTKKKLNVNTEIYILEALVAAALVLGILFVFFASRQPGTVDREPTKLDLLAKEAVTQDTLDYIKINPAGEKAKYAVFLSLCDKENMASVYHGTGKTSMTPGTPPP